MRFLHLLNFITLALFTGCLTDTNTTPLPDNNLPLDTTSHDIVWELDTIGTYGTILNDVLLINENNIWVVGEIHTEETDIPDSNGYIIPPFNSIHWNGSEWEFLRIPAVTSIGSISRGPLNAIFGFSSDAIWVFSNAGSYAFWNGINWTSEYVSERIGSIYRIWGSSLNNIYFVGSNGNITHFDGVSWKLLYSQTNIDLYDIWGNLDGSVSWACGYNQIIGTVLVKITSGTPRVVYEDTENLQNIREDSLSSLLTSVWTDNAELVYIISPAGMYKTESNTRGEAERIWYSDEFAPGFPRLLRGTASNNIFVVGDFSFIAHYNGNSWRHYNDMPDNIKINSISVKEKYSILVGIEMSSHEGILIKSKF